VSSAEFGPPDRGIDCLGRAAHLAKIVVEHLLMGNAHLSEHLQAVNW
jgi:hypothetical protein